MAAGELAVRQDEAPGARAWDEIASIAILLLAAVDLGGTWVPDASVGLLVSRVLWWLAYLAAATRLVQRCGTEWLTWTIRHQPALCALLVLTLASSLWSLAPAFTLQKSASLLGTTMLGVFIGTTCRPQGLVRVLHGTFAVLIVCSVPAELASPAPVAEGIRRMGWNGIMQTKNGFGAAAVLATLFFLIITSRQYVHPIWGAALSILSLIAAVQARSRTSFVALGVSLIAWAYLAIASMRRRPTRAMLQRLAILLVLSVSLLPLVIGPVAAALGNEDPLNGRTLLWDGALTILRERPATGYGYEAVWGRSDATLLPHIPVTARLWAENAHNSVVDVASTLGIPGAIVACIYLFCALADAGRLFERDPSAFSLYAVVFLVGFTAMGFTEAHLLKIHSLFWILFVALTVAVKRTSDRIETKE